MPKHTPGPWAYQADNTIPGSFDVRAPANVYPRGSLGVAWAHYRARPGEAEANARLIAAAPDMLAALEKHRDLLLQIAGAVMCDNLASISGLLEAEWDDMAAADLIAIAKGADDAN